MGDPGPKGGSGGVLDPPGPGPAFPCTPRPRPRRYGLDLALARQTQGYTENVVPPEVRERYAAEMAKLNKDHDTHALAQVAQVLDGKERLLKDLKKMNDEAQEGLHLESNGQVSQQFQQQYALLVRNLKGCNEHLMACFNNLHKRTDQMGFPLQVGSPLAASAPAFVPSPALQPAAAAIQHKVLEQVAAASCHIIDIANRQTAAMAKKQAPPGPKGKKAKAAAAAAAVAADEGAAKLKGLVESCVSVMYTLQQCANRSTPPLITAASLDMVTRTLQPESEQGKRALLQVQETIQKLKSQLLVVNVAAAAP